MVEGLTRVVVAAAAGAKVFVVVWLVGRSFLPIFGLVHSWSDHLYFVAHGPGIFSPEPGSIDPQSRIIIQQRAP